MSFRILVGDCRESLKSLADQSVQMCVTSPPYYGQPVVVIPPMTVSIDPTITEHIPRPPRLRDSSRPDSGQPNSVQDLAPLPQIVTPSNVLVGKREVTDAPDSAVAIREVSIASDLRAVLFRCGLKVTERQHGQCCISLDAEIRQERPQYRLGALVRGLIREKWASVVRVGFLFVIPTAKRLSQKADRPFIHHADADSGMVAVCLSLLAFVRLGFLNANVRLAINEARQVSNIHLSHTIPAGVGLGNIA